MKDLHEREVILECCGQWLALEGEYWVALLRLLPMHGLKAEAYVPLSRGQQKSINAPDAKKLVTCLLAAMHDIPGEDLWYYYEGEPDPYTCPPHDYFSGVGVSYLATLIGFIKAKTFKIEVSKKGTEYCFIGEMSVRPGR